MKLILCFSLLFILVCLPLHASAMQGQASDRNTHSAGDYSFGVLVAAGMLGAVAIKTIEYCFSCVGKKTMNSSITEQLIKDAVQAELRAPTIDVNTSNGPTRQISVCDAIFILSQGLNEATLLSKYDEERIGVLEDEQIDDTDKWEKALSRVDEKINNLSHDPILQQLIKDTVMEQLREAPILTYKTQCLHGR